MGSWAHRCEEVVLVLVPLALLDVGVQMVPVIVHDLGRRTPRELRCHCLHTPATAKPALSSVSLPEGSMGVSLSGREGGGDEIFELVSYNASKTSHHRQRTHDHF